MKRKPSETASYTVAKFAQLAGFDRHTLAARITEMGITPDGKAYPQDADLFRLRDLVRAALGGDIEAERLRKTREEADKLAIANARSRGELIEIQSVKKLGERVMIAIRQKILAFPISTDEQDQLLKELVGMKDMDWSREG